MRAQHPKITNDGETRVPDERDRELWRVINESPIVGEGPHIWVGTVAAYRAGHPHGQWISAARTVNEVERDIEAVLDSSPSKDDRDEPARWHAFSYAGFGRHEPDAGMSVREIVRRARCYREDLRAYTAWAWLGGDDRDWLYRFYDAYQGRFDRLEDWLVIEVERAGYDRVLDQVIPDALRPHVEINIDSLAHDLRESGAITTANDPERPGVSVFRMV